LREAKFIGVMPLTLPGWGLLTSAASLSLAVTFPPNAIFFLKDEQDLQDKKTG
jgi:hypothetical protein